MCAISALVGLLSAGVSAVGAMQQADAQADAANFEAEVARRNAKIADHNAREEIIRGDAEQKKQKRYTQELLGKQRAAMAANNIDVTHGSALDAATDTAMLGEIDALQLKANSYNRAYDQKVTAWNYKNKAVQKDNEASNARSAGKLSAFGTLLTGIGKAYSSSVG